MTTVQYPAKNGFSPRLRGFLHKSLREKIQVVQTRAARVLRTLVPVRLPFGPWWIRRNDGLGEPLMAGTFETAELTFTGRFLQPGMTVLDVGAHQGLYTLLASSRVGVRGKVFAFEPSPREQRALRLHLALNRCRNVVTQNCALGNEDAVRELYVVLGSQTGCNSLRPPVVFSDTATVQVQVVRLDDWLAEQKIDRVDFVKLDVEGAELAVLEGAADLLQRCPRPVLLAEVQDVRTRPWGYAAREILEYLARIRFTWLKFSENGSIEPLNLRGREFDGNFIACPEEKLEELRGRIGVR